MSTDSSSKDLTKIPSFKPSVTSKAPSRTANKTNEKTTEISLKYSEKNPEKSVKTSKIFEKRNEEILNLFTRFQQTQKINSFFLKRFVIQNFKLITPFIKIVKEGSISFQKRLFNTHLFSLPSFFRSTSSTEFSSQQPPQHTANAQSISELNIRQQKTTTSKFIQKSFQQSIDMKAIISQMKTVMNAVIKKAVVRALTKMSQRSQKSTKSTKSANSAEFFEDAIDIEKNK